MKALRLLTVVVLGLNFFSVSGRASLFERKGTSLVKIDESLAESDRVNWKKLTPAHDITGVGYLGVSFGFWDQDICTTFVIDTGVDAGPAYVLSNAHCRFFEDFGAEALKANEVRVDQPTSYYVSFEQEKMRKTDQAREWGKRVRFSLKEVKYITESGTDMQLYEVAATLGELKSPPHNLKPLKLKSTKPKTGDAVRIVGVPLRTVPSNDQVLHISDCAIGTVTKLVQKWGNEVYIYPESVRHQCSSIPGFSGGPLVDASGSVVLLNSHGTDDFSKDAACTYASMPCEVDAEGKVTVNREINYGQYVDGLSGCFNEKGVFTLAKSSCGLKKN